MAAHEALEPAPGPRFLATDGPERRALGLGTVPRCRAGVCSSSTVNERTASGVLRGLGRAEDRLRSRELIIPAPTVTPVASSMRMNEPVVRFLE